MYSTRLVEICSSLKLCLKHTDELRFVVFLFSGLKTKFNHKRIFYNQMNTHSIINLVWYSNWFGLKKMATLPTEIST